MQDFFPDFGMFQSAHIKQRPAERGGFSFPAFPNIAAHLVTSHGRVNDARSNKPITTFEDVRVPFCFVFVKVKVKSCSVINFGDDTDLDLDLGSEFMD